MKEVRVNISIPEATPEKLDQVEQSLVRQGVNVDSVLKSIGIISGKVEQSKVASLDVGKDATMELDESVQIPPPDTHLQ